MPASVGTPSHSSFVRKCAYAVFERAVEPLHSAISSFRPPNSSFPRKPESRGEVRVVAMTLELSHQPMHPIFMPWCAGTSRHERFVRKHVPDSDQGCALQSTSMPALHGRNVPNCRPMVDGGMRKCSAGACPPLGSGWGVAESTVPIRGTKPQLRLFIPWCAGTSRHERFVRKHVPDSDPGWTPPPAGDKRRHRSSEYSHRSTMC